MHEPVYLAFPRISAGYFKELLPGSRHPENFGCDELGQGECFPGVSSCHPSQARQINTFHWHITDSQSFPLEVAQYPELVINGAYSPQEVYTASDVQYIVQYAAAVRVSLYYGLLFVDGFPQRGIDVMMVSTILQICKGILNILPGNRYTWPHRYHCGHLPRLCCVF